MGCGASTKKDTYAVAKPLPVAEGSTGAQPPPTVSDLPPLPPPSVAPAPPRPSPTPSPRPSPRPSQQQVDSATINGTSRNGAKVDHVSSLPSCNSAEVEIKKEQQAKLASGMAQRGGTSIKLDPQYAEALRRKCVLLAQEYGGVEAMYDAFDVDKSKSLDLNEFRDLMMRLPLHKPTRVLRPEDKVFYINDHKGREHEVKKKEDVAEKPLTKREATALFWHLDEDESDHLELDEFKAWLMVGVRPQIESYRKGK